LFSIVILILSLSKGKNPRIVLEAPANLTEGAFPSTPDLP
jgi:hypothetical protein